MNPDCRIFLVGTRKALGSAGEHGKALSVLSGYRDQHRGVEGFIWNGLGILDKNAKYQTSQYCLQEARGKECRFGEN